MVYDELYLIDAIKDRLQGEGMTRFDEAEFEYDNCSVMVDGYVQEDCGFEYSTDHFLLSGMELKSRTAEFDRVVIYFPTTMYEMTNEELYALEKMLDV